MPNDSWENQCSTSEAAMHPTEKPENKVNKVTVLIVNMDYYLSNLALILSAFVISFLAVSLSTHSSALIIVLINLACCLAGFIALLCRLFQGELPSKDRS